MGNFIKSHNSLFFLFLSDSFLPLQCHWRQEYQRSIVNDSEKCSGLAEAWAWVSGASNVCDFSCWPKSKVLNMRLPWWLRSKEPAGRCRRCRFSPWVCKIPWRRKWKPTPVFLPGESDGQRSLVGYSSWGHRQSDMAECLTLSLFFHFLIELRKTVYLLFAS